MEYTYFAMAVLDIASPLCLKETFPSSHSLVPLYYRSNTERIAGVRGKSPDLSRSTFDRIFLPQNKRD